MLKASTGTGDRATDRRFGDIRREKKKECEIRVVKISIHSDLGESDLVISLLENDCIYSQQLICAKGLYILL
jgi:hypothetical protein